MIVARPARMVDVEQLAPGMVLCIEPAHHDEDVAGCHIENLVVVTDDGAEVLTDYESAWEAQVIEERGWC